METRSCAQEVVARALQGKRCWYVSTGGCVGHSFELALGEKVRRESPISNEKHPEDFRLFEGETNLLVWSSWRLEDCQRPLTSSDDASSGWENHLNHLLGAEIVAAEVRLPALDLTLRFDNGLSLQVFCDHVGDASFDGNWEISTADQIWAVGLGSKIEIEARIKEGVPHAS
jgi:hypothetical protein